MKKLLLILASVLLAIPAYAQSTLYSNSTTGNVGIGTTSPVQTLDVRGGGYFSGNVGIGTASPNGLLDVEGGTMLLNASSAFGAGLLNIMYSSATKVPITLRQTNVSTGTFLQFFDSGYNTIGYIGNNNNGTVSYLTSSDRRLKENIVPTTMGLSDLMKIQVDDFNFITDSEKTRMQGFVAQQLKDIYPEAVMVGSEDPKKKPWGVDYGRLTPLLVKSVQELKADNDRLQTQLAKDETTIEAMKAKLGM